MSPTNDHENQPPYTMHFNSDGASRDREQDVPGDNGKERMTETKDQDCGQGTAADTGTGWNEADKPFQSEKEVLLRELADNEEQEEWVPPGLDNLRRLEKFSTICSVPYCRLCGIDGKAQKNGDLKFMGGLARGFGFGIGLPF